LNYL